MNGANIKKAFEDIEEEYKDLIVREPAVKKLFTECIKEVNECIGGDADKLAPEPSMIMNAFRQTPWNELKVVIIGQDPYPREGDANGLCFSVNPDRTIPHSLRNIYKCLHRQKHMKEIPKHGDLSNWAHQGVLMLNASLTTTKGLSGGHLKIWEKYTDSVLENLATECAKQGKLLIFILWGAFAQKKANIINNVNAESIKNKWKITHRILQWGHPSPISGYNKNEEDPKHFIHCDNFTKCNEILEDYNMDYIDWNPDC